MLAKLIKYSQEYYPNIPLDDYLDSKYIKLSSEQLEGMNNSIKNGNKTLKVASICEANNLLFEIDNNIITLKKDVSGDYAYIGEIAQPIKGEAAFYFSNFAFDDAFETIFLDTKKTLHQAETSKKESEKNTLKIAETLSTFILAIG